jgi:hypothetical protein
VRGVARGDIDTRAEAINDRGVGETYSQDAERVTGQTSQGYTCCRRLTLTSAKLAFLVGVFARSADNSWLRDPATNPRSESRLGMGEHTDSNGGDRSRRYPLHERLGARVEATVVACLAIVVSILWMPVLPDGLNRVDSLRRRGHLGRRNVEHVAWFGMGPMNDRL